MSWMYEGLAEPDQRVLAHRCTSLRGLEYGPPRARTPPSHARVDEPLLSEMRAYSARIQRHLQVAAAQHQIRVQIGGSVMNAAASPSPEVSSHRMASLPIALEMRTSSASERSLK